MNDWNHSEDARPIESVIKEISQINREVLIRELLS